MGSCKSCGKGLCTECAVDLTKGLACRQRCERDVQALIELVDRNIRLAPATAKLLESARSMRIRGALFNLLTGFVFLWWGARDPDRLGFLVLLGVCFLGFGGFGFLQAWRSARSLQNGGAASPGTGS